MPEMRLRHPALDHLAAGPEILRLLLMGVTDEQTNWKPAPDRFSIAEVLEHLSHAEGHCFRHRIDRLLALDNPEIDDYDQNALYAEGVYSNRDAEESFAHWEEQREDNVEFLGTLDAAALDRTYMHPLLGEVTFAQHLSEWGFHDLGHIRQIAELVRSQLYYPEMGPFHSQYAIRP